MVTDTVPAVPVCVIEDDVDRRQRTVRIVHNLTRGAEQTLTTHLDQFRLEHPLIWLEVERLDGSFAENIAAIARLPESERPDVFLGSNETVRLLHDSGLFVPPSACEPGGQRPPRLDGLLPVIERTYSVEGELVAAPYNASTAVVLYDRNRWRAAGIDPDDPPETWDEFEVVVRQLRDSGAAATGMVLYDRSASWLVEQSAAKAGTVIVEPANGRAGTEISNVAFFDPDTIATLERFRNLNREGYVHLAGVNQAGIDDLVRLVDPEAPSGLTLHTSAAIGDVLRAASAGGVGVGDVDVGAAPFPGAGPGGMVGGGAWWLLDSGDPGQVGAAWTVVEWLVEPDRIAELAAETGYVPTTEAAAASAETLRAWAEQPALRVAYDQLAATPDTAAAAGLQIGPMIEVRRSLEVAATNVVGLDRDPVAELTAAAETSRAALDLYAASVPGPGDVTDP